MDGLNSTKGDKDSDLHERDKPIVMIVDDEDSVLKTNELVLEERLQSEAGTGQILINQRTFSMVKDVIETEKIHNVTIKGLNKPVTAYNVLGMV